MMPTLGEGAALVGSAVGGGALLKLAQTWLETRSKIPSHTKDAAELIAATAAFQIALNTAAQGIVGDLRQAVERLEAEIDDLKLENERCRSEAEALKQADRERAQQFRSLTNLLRRKGIDLSAEGLDGSLIHFEDDKAEVLIPGPKEGGS